MEDFNVYPLNNTKRRIPLKQNNEDELIEIIGKTRLSIDDTPGRGLFKDDDDVRLIQVAMPAAGETSLEVINNVQAEAEAMDHAWDGARPKPIPMVPDEITPHMFLNRADVQAALQAGMLPLGLDYQMVKPVIYNPRKMGNLAVMGDQMRYFKPLKAALFQMVCELGKQVGNVLLVDSGHYYDNAPEGVNGYYSTSEELVTVKNQLMELLDNNTDSNWYYVVITDIERFIEQSQISYTDLDRLLRDSIGVHLALIVVGTNSHMGLRIDPGTSYRKYLRTGVFASRMQDQKLYDVQYNLNEPELEPASAFFTCEREFIKFKFMTMDGDE